MALAEPLGPGPAPFSVLMPVYRGDHAPHVRRAIESNTVAQTRPPAQLVIVRDGPVPPDVAAELARGLDRGSGSRVGGGCAAGGVGAVPDGGLVAHVLYAEFSWT